MVKFNYKDKLVCINDKPSFYNTVVNLTYGKVYELSSSSVTNRVTGQEIVVITDDLGIVDLYTTDRFVCIKEYREVVINSILDI